MPAVVMDATSDEPCNVFITAAIRNGISTPNAPMCQAEQALAEHFRHAGLLAEPLQTAGGADHQQECRRHRRRCAGPIGIGEQTQAPPQVADGHDADADQKQDQRPADADDQLALWSAAERFAGHFADRLHHQQHQRDRDRHNEHDRIAGARLLRGPGRGPRERLRCGACRRRPSREESAECRQAEPPAAGRTARRDPSRRR